MEQLKPKLEQQVDRLRGPFWAFIGAQRTASAFLILALVAALLVTNSPYADLLPDLQAFSLGLIFGGTTYEWSLLHFVNDGLIAIFFFVIGLEVKRELLAGELRDRERVGLLLSAALGGMMVPATLYLAFNLGSAQGLIDGWGIPMATDTAIAIGILAALGSRVPRSVVAFIVGVAIVDDIGAILVIAFAYTQQVCWVWLAFATLLLMLLVLLNLSGIRHPLLYAAAGVVLWIAIVQSGIHASIAGVVVAATVPARPRVPPEELKREVGNVVSAFDDKVEPEQVLGEAGTHRRITEIENLAQEATTPLRRWEDSLGLPVALIILPLFAFLNAGIAIDMQAMQRMLNDPVALGIIAGLVLGKPAGILAGVWLGETLGFAKRPGELSLRRLFGVGLLAGIGFTMSTFIAHLALSQDATTLAAAKLAIVVASTIAAVSGFAVLRFGSRET